MTNPDKHMPEEIFADLGGKDPDPRWTFWKHSPFSGCTRYVRADLIEKIKDKSK